MNKFIITTTLIIFIGIFINPIDSGDCTCTCTGTTVGTTTVLCSTCDVAYCRSTYGSCLSANPVSSTCSGVTIPIPMASIIVNQFSYSILHGLNSIYYRFHKTNFYLKKNIIKTFIF
ncbi:hypothetical protein I4U23_023345 [Adineta vaga]|nr:hypothetical protein I4U23_023345 [Adineta vaga]